MEYQPYKTDHNSNVMESYLNEYGRFLTFPSLEDTVEFLCEEAKKYVIRKAGGEKAENCIYNYDTPFEKIDVGFYIRQENDNLGFTLCEKVVDKNVGVAGYFNTYYITKTLSHYKYMKNLVPAHKKSTKTEKTIDPKVISFGDVLRELQIKGRNSLKKTEDGVSLIEMEIDSLPELDELISESDISTEYSSSEESSSESSDDSELSSEVEYINSDTSYKMAELSPADRSIMKQQIETAIQNVKEILSDAYDDDIYEEEELPGEKIQLTHISKGNDYYVDVEQDMEYDLENQLNFEDQIQEYNNQFDTECDPIEYDEYYNNRTQSYTYEDFLNMKKNMVKPKHD